MFIDNKLANERVDGDDNLVNLVLGISSPKRIVPSVTSISNDNGATEKLEDSPAPANDSDDDADDVPEALVPEVLIGAVKSHNRHGRKLDGNNVSMELRHAAGLLAQTDSIKNVSAALGVSMNTVAMAKHGASVHGKDNAELKERLDKDLAIVRDRALDRLLSSLDLLDDDKIKKCSAKDISGISANMAKVMQSTLPKDTENLVRAQLIVYAPTQINETKYERVEL